MPLYIPVEEAREGMRLAESFTFMGRPMIAAGKVLTTSDVDKLRNRFSGVYLRVNDPLLDGAIEFEDDSHERSVARHVQTKITECLSSVEQRFDARTSPDDAIYKNAQSVVEQMIAYLADNPVSAAMLDQQFDGNNYVSKHAGNVFYLSLILGSAAQSYVTRVRSRKPISKSVASSMLPLGLGAMFIDLAMQPLRHLFEAPCRLTDELRQQIRQHPIVGADMLPKEFPGLAKQIVRTHHENCDGRGYPEQLDKDKLHVFSRIVRIADAYDSAISTHIYPNGKSPALALWAMQSGPYKQFFDPMLMKIFGTLIQPFPIGAKLRLTDGTTGCCG